MSYPTQQELKEMGFSDALDNFCEQQSLTRFDGRQGVVNMCIIARSIGYKDPQYFGQLTSKACIGDLITMLEDNPGMIQAMLEWLGGENSPEWLARIKQDIGFRPSEAESSENG